METRELFWGLPEWGRLAFYALGYAAIAIALGGIARAIGKYRRAAAAAVPVDWMAGMGRMLAELLTHRRLRRGDAAAGSGHAAIFFGFALLFAGTSIITLEVDLLKPAFGITFWKGGFFLAFSLVLDLAGAALFAGLVFMAARRLVRRPPRLDYARVYRGETGPRPAARRWRIEDGLFLAALLIIVATGFVQEGLRHAMEHPAWGLWEPVGHVLGAALAAALGAPELEGLRRGNWWLHGVAALAFVAAVPWWKAKHILAALGSLSARDPLAVRRLPHVGEHAAAVGYARIGDFSVKDMLDLDACTRCGRCHDACPARASGYPLSPRDFILDLRGHNDRVQGRETLGTELVGGVIEAATVWSCRSCGACQEACPVGVEHPVKIVQLRRRLVDRGELDPLLKQTFENIANTGNSFGESARLRSAWTRELEFRVKDIRAEAAALLWFVGDYASFDPRNQKVSRTFARLLHAAGQDFALLHEGEKTAGNDVRRAGEEGLFESLVEHNLGRMHAAQPFQGIVTTDPHSLNTLHNEYPEFGRTAPVRHYTEVLCELLEAGRLVVRRPLGLRVTFHDPCHLGRLNRRFDAPRKVLEQIGCTLVEMPRNRENSFCCGAGGGRIWIPEQPGTVKPSELRIREAAALAGVDVFVTCCPKDLNMFEDARKGAGLERAFTVEDIAELVARAVDLHEPAAQGAVPPDPTVPAGALASAPAPGSGAEAASVAAMPPAEDARGRPSLPPTPFSPFQPVALPDYDIPARTGRRILVAIKHAARLGDDFRIGEDGRSIADEYFEFALNEFDDVALEQALQTAERLAPCEVVAVTVGPGPAEESLRKALAKGADRAVRVWDDALGGAPDPIAVARLLAGVAAREAPDLVFTGVQSSDQASGATGAALARLLGWSCAAVVVATQWDGGPTLEVARELEGGLRQRLRIPAPAVVTMQTGANTPRYATMRMLKQAKTKPLAVVAAGAEVADTPAAVVQRRSRPVAERAQMIPGTAAEVAARVLEIVRARYGGAR
jgi:Fe-S oxidoreductase/electron transfer flavoprotein alpha/beta subunit